MQSNTISRGSAVADERLASARDHQGDLQSAQSDDALRAVESRAAVSAGDDSGVSRARRRLARAAEVLRRVRFRNRATYDITLEVPGAARGRRPISPARSPPTVRSRPTISSCCATTGIFGRPTTSRRSYERRCARARTAHRDGARRARARDHRSRGRAHERRRRRRQTRPEPTSPMRSSIRCDVSPRRARRVNGASIRFGDVGVRYPDADRDAIDARRVRRAAGRARSYCSGRPVAESRRCCARSTGSRRSRPVRVFVDGSDVAQRRSGRAATRDRLCDSSRRAVRAHDASPRISPSFRRCSAGRAPRSPRESTNCCC